MPSSGPQHREAISKVDLAWLRMEQSTNLMMITGVVIFAEPLDFERLKDTVERRLLPYRRFRQKAVTRPNGAWWQLDDDFDLNSHIRRTALPGKADIHELEELVSELASSPLDKARPLWQFHLVENYEGGPVLVTRIHHCIADGIALIQVLLSLTDPGRDPRPSSRDAKTWQSRRARESSVFRRLMEPARDGIDFASLVGQKAIEEMFSILQEPERLTHYAGEIGEVVEELVSSVSLSPDPPTRLKGPLGPRKRVSWARPIPLTEVKAISRALGCTVNDLLITAVTGAIHSYLLEQGEPLDEDTCIRATVPVNLRPLEHARELGNHFGLVFLDLPIGESNPLHRLRRVSQRMNELKASKQAAVSFGLLAALGMGPHFLQKPTLEYLSHKASAVLTNVPGPQRPLYMAGAAIGELMFWVPQNGSIGMGISILSYNKQVFFGLITDRKRVPDPARIIERFQPQFENLLYLTLMMGPENADNPELVAAQLELERASGRNSNR